MVAIPNNPNDPEFLEHMALQADQSLRMAVQMMFMVARKKGHDATWIREQVQRRLERAIDDFSKDIAEL